jgi:site-specific recombinase XerD
VDLETVRDVLGHNNVTTTALYLHAADERKRRAARRLKLL